MLPYIQGIKVFVDVIKLRISNRGDFPGLPG
jgi:hypothetical protein